MTLDKLYSKSTSYLSLVSLTISITSSILVYYLEPWYLGLGLFFAPMIFYHIIKKPIVGIYLLVPLSVILPPAPQEIGPLEIIYIAIFALTVFAWVIQFKYFKHGQLFLNRLIPPFLVLYILIFISFFTRQLSDTTLYHWVRGVIPFLNLCIFFVLLSEIKDIRDVNRITWVFRLTAIILIISVANSVFPVLGGAITAENFIEIRASLEEGTFGPLTAMLPVFLFSLWINRVQSEKLDLVILIALILIATITFLRSLVLIFAFMGIIIIFRYFRRSGFQLLPKIILVVFFLIFSIILAYVTSEKIRSFLDLIYIGFSSRFERLETVGDVRMLETKEVLYHFKESPVIGHGIGFQFSYDRGEFMGPWKTFLWSGGYTHNIFTYFLLVFGVIGVVILFWIIYSVWREYRLGTKHISDNMIQGYLFAVGMGLLAMFLYANFQSVYRSLNYLLLISILLATLVKLRIFHQEAPKT